MSKCPECGRENVLEPAGHLAPCGRRVQYGDAPGVLYPTKDQWRERMSLANLCCKAASAIGDGQQSLGENKDAR